MSWKTCTSCRKNTIDFGAVYWECSVSTCNRKRTGLYFCSVGCWDAHLPEARHREAWAVEKKAPSKSEWEAQDASEAAPKRRVVGESKPVRRTIVAQEDVDDDADLPKDVLVVVSKLKNYIKAKSGMKTSDTVVPVLSDELRRICNRAIRVAGQNERKTVLDRDVREALKD